MSWGSNFLVLKDEVAKIPYIGWAIVFFLFGVIYAVQKKLFVLK